MEFASLIEFYQMCHGKYMGHFCKIMRRHDSFIKQLSDKTKKCGIKRFYNNFIVYGSMLNHIKVYHSPGVGSAN
jgi:hypothetical protein